MKPSKMLELVENLKVGEKVVIEKFKDHLFIDKKSLPTEWIPAPSDVMCAKCGGSRVLPTGKVKYSNPEHVEYKCKDCNCSFYVVSGVHSNINVHGVDLSILNEEDWFYVETSYKYLFKGDMLNENRRNLTYAHHRGSLSTTGIALALCDKDDITLLRKATPDDLAPLFEKYPQYSPVKVGDIGLFYNKKDVELKAIKDGELNLSRVEGIDEIKAYPFSTKYSHYKHFFKVHESETISEIRERFLKQN